jgi:uncharacterized protein YqgC (DUF456 family)
MQPQLVILYKVLGSLLGALILAPLSVLICLPYLLVAAKVDKEEYWASFWWRAKRIASAGAFIGGIIGVCIVPWT